MFARNLVLIACAAAVAAVLTTTSSQARMTAANTNNLTFSHAVALPGVTLPAGTYAFESGPGGSNPNVVRVMTSNGQKQVFVGITIPTERPTEARDRLVSFGEAPACEPTPIAAWYPFGSMFGQKFLYR